MNPLLLVLRSGERPFVPALAPGMDVLEKRTHDFSSLFPEAPVGVFDMVLFTSGAAVRRFFSREDLVSRLGGAAIHAVGPSTGAVLRGQGVANVRDGGGSARSLLETLPDELAGVRVLLPRGDDAGGELPRGLEARGAAVVPLALYRKAPLAYDTALDAAIAARPPAVWFATSPAAARWFFEGASPESAERVRRTPAVALGRPTGSALASLGVERVSIARPATFESAGRLAARLAAALPPT